MLNIFQSISSAFRRIFRSEPLMDVNSGLSTIGAPIDPSNSQFDPDKREAVNCPISVISIPNELCNLNSLPDELMARVLKHSSYLTVLGLRKMDSRIDKIAKKYELGTRLPVQRLSFLVKKRKIQMNVYLTLDAQNIAYHGKSIKKMGIRNHDGSRELTHRINIGEARNSFEKLEIILNKIQVEKSLFLHCRRRLDENLFNALNNHKRCFKNMHRLHLCIDEISCPKISVQHLLANCAILQELSVTGGDSLMNLICNYEVLGGRQWKSIDLSNKGYSSHGVLKREFMDMVVKNCAKFRCWKCFGSQFDVSDLLDFFEDCYRESNFFKEQKWTFANVRGGNYTKVDVINRLRKMKGILRFSEVESDGFKVKIPTSPHVEVYFFVAF